MAENERNPALDVVRIIATFCVISFHYGLKSGLLVENLVGFHMFIMCTLREALMICVPAFLMLTGYLMRRKTWHGRFYRGIVKTMVIYALASAVCYFSANRRLGLGFITGLANYTASRYGWYIEMYIGLFLLIPFLNVMYSGGSATLSGGVDTRKYKTALLSTFLVLTAAPGVVNIFCVSWEWWKSPSISSDYVKIIPAWWMRIYPITYYLIGCYLSEYGLKLRRKTCGLLFLASVFAKGAFAYYRADGGPYVAGSWQDWGSLLHVIQTTLFFSFVSTADLGKLSLRWKKVLHVVSDLCLGAYLVSSVGEDLFYPAVFGRIEQIVMRQDYNLIMSTLVFILSLALSAIINMIYKGLEKFCNAMAFRIKKMSRHKLGSRSM